MSGKKQITALLAAAIFLGTATSCGGGAAEATETEAASTEETSAAPSLDSNGFLLDSLPKTLDFKGETVTILGWDHYEDVEFYAEELTGDVVNDAFFERNRDVEERLQIKLEFMESRARGAGETFIDLVNSSVMSGSGDYDIVAAHSHRTAVAASNGLLLNLFDINYLDFEKPWWSKSLQTETTIAGSLYFAAGDISISAISRMQGIFFNNNLITDFKLEDPYDLVVSGKWTYDKMMEMSSDVYSDLNGNEKKDESDRFGFCSDNVQLQTANYSIGVRYVDNNGSDGLGISNTLYSERCVQLIEQLCNFMHTSKDAICISSVDDDKIFTDGRALFFAFPLALISSGKMRTVKFNYGFVPWPKFEETDEKYLISSSNAFSLWAIPVDAVNTDMSGAVMEALASGGYRKTSPALFETAYKVKYNNIDSERQSSIFDMMKANITYDIGKLFFNALQAGNIQIANMIFQNDVNWISTIDSNKEKYQESLNKLFETFKEATNS